MNLSFEKKLLLLFSIVTVGLISVGIGTYKINEAEKDADKLVQHTREVLYQTEQVFSLTQDIVLGSRGYVITGNPSFLQPFIEAKKDIVDDLTKLEKLVSDNPAQKARIDSLKIWIAERIDISAQTIALRKQKGFAEAQQLIADGNGDLNMGKLRNEIVEIQTDENKLLESRQKAYLNAQTIFRYSFYTLLGGMLLLLMVGYFVIRHNFSKRKKAEEKILLYVDIVKNMTKGLLVFKVDKEDNPYSLRLVVTNQAATLFTGFDAQPLIGKTIVEVYPNLGGTTMPAIYQEVALNNKSINIGEFEYGDANIEQGVFSIVAFPLPDKSVGVTFENITERKKAEEVIIKKEKGLSEAQRIAKMGSWDMDVATGTVSWSAEMFNVFNCKPEIFTPAADSLVKLLAPEYRETMSNWIAGAMQGKEQAAIAFQLADGSNKWIEGGGNVIFNANGQPVKATGTAQDITERKKAEEALQVSLKETSDYKFALDESTIVAITDQKGIIKQVNDNFCKISKYSREELIGQDHRIVNSDYHPKEFIRDLWATIANGNIWVGEIKNKAKDGTFYWVDTTIVPFLNEQGKPYQYLAIRADITERKKAEEQLVAAHQELETFSYSVSHDLRAPLRSLEGFSKALLENYKGKFDADGERWLNHIASNAHRMGMLINDMLTFSKISRTEVVKTKVNMRLVAEEIYDTEKNNYAGKTIHFDRQNIPEAYGDAVMLRQVWHNLISNALKYSSKKEVMKITISGKSENGFNVYSIKDNGAGFDEKYKDKLFAVFSRLHANNEFEGTGVGLAIVHRIIKKHGGTISANSVLAKGTEFIFALPILTN